ncbi:MAG TPA: Yip1 family protein [Vicinamibacterales bacterium]|jgi:hypothetical protein
MGVTQRAVNILVRPASEWRVIAGESADVTSLIINYAAPLSGVAAISRWLGLVLHFGRLGIGFLGSAIFAIMAWALGLLGLWIAAIVIEHLAPTFSSRSNTVQALKLVVYASTPVWIVGILGIVPMLGVLWLVGFAYAVYLFYIGLPIVLETPADKVVPYMVASAVVVFIANYIVTVATRMVAAV